MKVKYLLSALSAVCLLLLGLGRFCFRDVGIVARNVGKISSTAAITAATTAASAATTSNDNALHREKPADINEDNAYTIQQLNQVIWVVAGVLTYNDVRFLEEADKVLSESYIDLTHTNDPVIIGIIGDIRDLISNMRIEEGDREIMEQEIAARRANALWDSLNSLSASGTTPTSCAVNLLTSSVQSYANYRRETKSIERDFKKQQWELDKKRLKELSGFNTELLKASAILMKEIGVTDDSQRLSVADAQALRDQLKGGYTEDVLTYLANERTENTYKNLPEYWYHRGARMLKSADECQDAQLAASRKADARKCFEKYQNIFSPSFRRSRDAVAVAGGMLKLLGEEYANGNKRVKKQMLEQAAIIERFSDQSDLGVWWHDNFVLYTTYRALGERAKATNTLLLTISTLKTASSLMTQEIISKPIGKGTPRPVRSYTQPIALCMQTLSDEYAERGAHGEKAPLYAKVLDDFLKEEYAAVQTQLSHAGKISENKQAEIVLAALGTPPNDPNDDVVNCAIWEYHKSENALIFQIPIKFFLTDDTECAISFTTKKIESIWGDKESKSATVNEQLKTRGYLHPKGSEDIYAVQLEYVIKGDLDVDIADFDEVRLDIMHKNMPIALTFTKEYRDPVRVEFGKVENGEGSNKIQYRCTKDLSPRIKYHDMEDRFEEVEEVEEKE